jgi:hypothetical protein
MLDILMKLRRIYSVNRAVLRLIACLICTISAFSDAYAENITLVKQFNSLGGTVDFLPGAWVSVWEGGKSTYYKYESGQYVKSDAIPLMLKDWESMSWGDFPFAQLGSVQRHDSKIDAYIPKQATVNQVISIQRKEDASQDLVLVCYTLAEEKPEDEMYPDDVYITALTATTEKLSTKYKLLWTKKLEAEVNFGYIQVQLIPSFGRFLIFYWGQPTGDSFVAGMNVYRLEGI